MCSRLLQRLLNRALGDEAYHLFVDKVFMTLLFVCSREVDTSGILHEIEIACQGETHDPNKRRSYLTIAIP